MRPVAKGSQPAVVKIALPLVVRSRISRLSDLPEPVRDVQRFRGNKAVAASRGITRSATRQTWWSRLLHLRGLSDPDNRFGDELEAGDREVLRCGPLADATGSIIVRSVARAEPASEITRLP